MPMPHPRAIATKASNAVFRMRNPLEYPIAARSPNSLARYINSFSITCNDYLSENLDLCSSDGLTARASVATSSPPEAVIRNCLDAL